MKKIFTLTILLILVFSGEILHAQSCAGEVMKFRETFGAGTGGAALPTGRTNYSYKENGSLNDGDYRLSSTSQAKPEWHIAPDHTGDVNGRMMVTNASYTPGEFYRDTVYGLSSTSNFSVYLYAMNVNTVGTCSPNPILARLELVVESYNADGSFTPISTVISPDLPQTSNPTWAKVSGSVYLPINVTAVRYRVINNATGGCGNDIAIDDITFSQCSPSILPVSGMSLKASSNASSVVLSWSTLQENNTEKFIIEKSADGRNWKTLTAVKAAGNSSDRRNYEVKDENPYSPATHYRVANMDISGKITYSNAVLIKPAASGMQITAFPNPFMSSVGIEVAVTENKPGAVLRLFNLNGKMVRSMPWNLRQGTNVTTLGGMDHLGAGICFLDVVDNSGRMLFKTRLVKQ